LNEITVGIRRVNFELGDNLVKEEVFKAIELIGGVPEKLESASKIL